MAKNMKDTLTDWLRDAHAMESATIGNLEKQVEKFAQHPGIQGKFKEHLEESRRQVKDVERCLEILGAEKSAMKDAGMKVVNWAQLYTTGGASDDLVKQLLAAEAFEHFELASYRSLVTAAQQAGEPEIARICEQIMREEDAMAAFIASQIPNLTRVHMQQATA